MGYAALRTAQERYDYMSDSAAYEAAEDREEWIQNRIEELSKDPDMIYAVCADVPVKVLFGVYKATTKDYISKLSDFAEAIDKELRIIAESEYGVKK